MVAATLLAVAAFVWVALRAERVLVWTLVSLLLAMALNPAVDGLQRAGLRRGAAAAVVYLLGTAFLAGIGALVVPTLVQQVGDFIDALPGYVRELTAGRGPLGFLETKYHVVERVQDAVGGGGGAAASSLAGGASAAIDVTRSVVTFIAGVVTITFLTLFMLLEGPRWVDRGIEMLPAERRPEWRTTADEIYRMVGRYVTGNLLISLIAGCATTIVLLALGIPFALALGLLVAILDLIPLAGATLGALVVTLVALTDSVTSAIVVAAFFVVYQQIENHLLQPLIYGRTVRLSPLAILLSVLIGAEVAGVVGALVAIPVGGTVQILLEHWQRRRRGPDAEPAEESPGEPPGEPRPPAEPAGRPPAEAEGEPPADTAGEPPAEAQPKRAPRRRGRVASTSIR
jgi:predicted PurR-regulated permease PerM